MLQEQFQQHWEWLIQLEPTTNPSVHAEEMMHLTNKLQQLAVTLQLCPPSRPMEEPLHTAMQKYTDTLYTPHSDKQTSPHLYYKASTYVMDRTVQSWEIGSVISRQQLTPWRRVKHAWLRPNHMAWPTLSFVRHSKLGSAGMTLGIYYI